ncbi:hypothetical protein HQ496_13880 [bacterium]|nr:hypothetical protein [bacterium]
MSESAHFSSKNTAIVEQLAYLIDELEAQRPWITRIPEFQLTGKPMDSTPSLLEMYIEMSRMEWDEFLPSLGVPNQPGKDDPSSISEVLDHIQEGRRALVSKLEATPSSDWSDLVEGTDTDLFTFAFQITQSDSTFLKSIAERLHESMITFSR